MKTLLALALLVLGRSAAAQRIDVAPTGPVVSLAAAVASAPAGATIVVHAGTYRERRVVVDRPLRIVGEAGAVIDGENQGEILEVRADDVTVRGLTLRNVGPAMVEDRAAIRVTAARDCSITDNRIENGFFGIYLANVTGCRIARNQLHAQARSEAAAGNGIHLWSSREIRIDSNVVRGHRDGIYFEFVHNTVVRGNVSEGNLRYGMHFMYSDDCEYLSNTFRRNGSGVAVMYTRRIRMADNRFENNWGAASYGLLLKEIADAHLERNAFVGNTTGLLADGTTRLIATGNEFRGNGWAVRLDANSIDGRFTANSFSANTFDVATNGASHSTEFAGNYWASYQGYDLDHDGVGDVPHHPVRLFSMIVEQNQPALILLRSPLVALLDAAEQAMPVLTPETIVDRAPAMRSTMRRPK